MSRSKLQVLAVKGEGETDYVVECEESGWHPRYRLRNTRTKHKTHWASYEQALMLDDKVAISPYYTGFSQYALYSPVEACKILCATKAR